MGHARYIRLLPLVGLAAYNVVQNRFLPDRAYVPANVAVTGALLALARRSGCSWEELGLNPPRMGSGLPVGLAGAAVAATVVGIGSGSPLTRPFFLDERSAGDSPPKRVYRVAVRFPLGTALFEEVAFRGVVPAMWRRPGVASGRSNLVGAVAFGLWHLLPTRQALAANPIGGRLEYRQSRWGVMASGATMAGLAALGLSWLRERTGTLAAPWLVHAAFNTSGYLAGVAAWKNAAGAHR